MKKATFGALKRIRLSIQHLRLPFVINKKSAFSLATIIIALFLSFSNVKPCYSAEVLTGFDEKRDLDVLNNELKRINNRILDKSFRAWEVKKVGTTYTAGTDGFVVGYNTSDVIATGYSNANSTPTTIRVQGRMGLCMPVIKGDRWQATGVTTLFWLPYKR